MKLPIAIPTGLTQVLPSGSHADREIYYLFDQEKGERHCDGLFLRMKRSGGVYLSPVHEEGVLALREANHKGSTVYRIAEFVRCHEAEDFVLKAGFKLESS
jgi:hypothetical protein